MSGISAHSAAFVACAALLAAGAAVSPRAQGVSAPALGLPANVKTLEGLPRVQVETSDTATTRRLLDAGGASRNRLVIRVDNGRYYWGSEPNPLAVNTSGEFIYLSAEPGKYVRIRRVNDKLSYVEHVDMGTRSVTYWGELRLVLGK